MCPDTADEFVQRDVWPMMHDVAAPMCPDVGDTSVQHSDRYPARGGGHRGQVVPASDECWQAVLGRQSPYSARQARARWGGTGPMLRPPSRASPVPALKWVDSRSIMPSTPHDRNFAVSAGMLRGL